MNTDDLNTKPDAELNQIFATEVVGFQRANPEETRPEYQHWIPPGKPRLENGAYTERPARFCADANAVLPWLEKRRWHTAPRYPDADYSVAVQLAPGVNGDDVDWNAGGHARTFARAAVIALIRAKRAEKGTS